VQQVLQRTDFLINRPKSPGYLLFSHKDVNAVENVAEPLLLGSRRVQRVFQDLVFLFPLGLKLGQPAEFAFAIEKAFLTISMILLMCVFSSQ
jgi:hypothetical protein